jgi:uncharacterized RmlC-like cupin family protein
MLLISECSSTICFTDFARSFYGGGKTVTESLDNKYLVDAYGDWIRDEGISVISDFSVDLDTAAVQNWERFGAKGAVIKLVGGDDMVDLWLLEIASATSTNEMHHLFEAIVYVISGHGSTSISLAGREHHFEWGPKSMFAIPLNAVYRIFNTQGSRPARLAVVTSFPITMNLYHNAEFIFNNNFEFPERSTSNIEPGDDGRLITLQRQKETVALWETDFVSDLGGFDKLRPLDFRGKASSNITFIVSGGSLHAHISEIPVGSYKKAHKHPDGTHIFPVTGRGYSLLWYPGDREPIRVDWSHGTAFAPPDAMYHQHFNVSAEPARYFAVRMGSQRHPVTSEMREYWSRSPEERVANREQIEYEDEDPSICEMYRSELREIGIDYHM